MQVERQFLVTLSGDHTNLEKIQAEQVYTAVFTSIPWEDNVKIRVMPIRDNGDGRGVDYTEEHPQLPGMEESGTCQFKDEEFRPCVKRLAHSGRHLIVTSPGGGSKFC